MRFFLGWNGEYNPLSAFFPPLRFPPMNTPPQRQSNSPNIFWGEMSPCEHLVQIYDEETVMLDSLEGFVGGGIESGEAVIVIASELHLASLDERLRRRGLDVAKARTSDQYIPLGAEETLARFMVDGWPDDERFREVISDVLMRAQAGGRKVRAFGEMVAFLWAQGHAGATVRLEHMWHKLCHEHGFSLFCAYPKIGFTQNAEASLKEICAAHSRVIAG